MRKSEKVIILNINRRSNNRAVRKALNRVSFPEQVLIVDLLWSPTFKFKSAAIKRSTLGELISSDDWVEESSKLIALINELSSASSDCAMEAAAMYDNINLLSASKNRLNFDLTTYFSFDYLLVINKLLSIENPEQVFVIFDSRLSYLLPKLTNLRNIPTEVIQLFSLRKFLSDIRLRIQSAKAVVV